MVIFLAQNLNLKQEIELPNRKKNIKHTCSVKSVFSRDLATALCSCFKWWYFENYEWNIINLSFSLQERMARRALAVKKKKNPGDFIPGETFSCPEPQCDRMFQNISSLSRHLVLNHHYGAAKAKKSIQVFKSRRSLDGK